MIERKLVQDNLRTVLVEEFLSDEFNKIGYSHAEIHKTPLGEKIVIHASRPGLIVGAKGSNVKRLTKQLKQKFNFENPQIEIEEVKDTRIDAKIVAESIASTLERFGAGRFKDVGYRAIENAIHAGALGIEILISGKVPSSRSRRWRFYKGYLKKCGDVAASNVWTAYSVARLKSGVVGIQVRIMPPGLVLPDKILLNEAIEEVTEEPASDEEVAADVKAAEEQANGESESTKEPSEQKESAEEQTKETTEKKEQKSE